ncbi:MAG: Sporulation initiation inhibitor protein Soj [Chlamydiae bacterium]|nr:Sporulation initiation inhibitor protein Soj [Chlamydiota bacterium]
MTSKKPTIIAVSSFKGGTAKTSIALHIGSALEKYHNKKVLLVDFDAQANLTTGLGFDPDHQDSLASVLQRKKDLLEVKLLTSQKNLDLIPADTWLERLEVSGELATDRYSHEKLKLYIQDLDYDYILIDTPPSLCWLTESALIAADYSLICTTPEFYSVKGLERLSQFLQNINNRHPLKVLGVAVSFWNQRGKSNEAFLEVIEQTFPNKLFIQKIRRDISVSEAAIYGKPLYDTSPSSRAASDYKALTDEIMSRM